MYNTQKEWYDINVCTASEEVPMRLYTQVDVRFSVLHIINGLV